MRSAVLLHSIAACGHILGRALEGYQSNHNVVYSSKYPCVWTPKYRRSVLVGPIAIRCEQIIRQNRSKISGRNPRFRNHARAGACSGRSGPSVRYASVRYSSARQKSQRGLVAQLAARVSHIKISAAYTVDEPAIWYPPWGEHPWRAFNHRLKIRKTFKYRLYPNRKQRESWLATLEVCRHLYNDALQERREAWKVCRTPVTFAMQSAQLPANKPMRGCKLCMLRYSRTCCIGWTKPIRRSFAGARDFPVSKEKAGLIPSPIPSLVSTSLAVKYRIEDWQC